MLEETIPPTSSSSPSIHQFAPVFHPRDNKEDKEITRVSGRITTGQQEYSKIRLIFQIRKGRTKAAIIKPAKEMRVIVTHVDLASKDKRIRQNVSRK